ncbi:MAG: type I restriction endonuclease [Candidatus Methanoperedens sp.]|nr:type I restriction endonuclease [Candidatus Methanoperedens sp.]MCZ7369860.1 type I restriction endonuclease [Candidatus Methanoperedens sp.]
MTESEVEEGVLEILSELGYEILNGLDIAPDGINAERRSYSDTVLVERLRDAVDRINPNIPEEAREEAIKKVLRTESPQLIINNQNFHKKLVEGVDIEYRKKDGKLTNDKVWLFDFKNPQNNEFLAVNQFTILENNNNRRPDIILFINGLPLVVIELKNPADENATIWTAFNQLETYKSQIPSLFSYNEILVISDGIEARAGTITSNKERFMPWKTIEGKEIEPSAMPQLEVLFQGMFNKKILLDLIRHFIVFEQERQDIHKKLAAYHQYHAVNKAIDPTLPLSSDNKI